MLFPTNIKAEAIDGKIVKKMQGRSDICPAWINRSEDSFDVWNDFRNKFLHSAKLGTGQGIQFFINFFPHFRGVLLFRLFNLYKILDSNLKNTAETR